ncbi:MAG TPA: SdrD B-like domain-containing protein, partial [Gemmataceae bacterium]|nr:SdrD B-like domain-containing protein [Gemmataceae bacterium]
MTLPKTGRRRSGNTAWLTSQSRRRRSYYRPVLESLEERVVPTEAFPTPLLPAQPLGSLVYSGTVPNRVINFPGETNRFTLSLDAAQVVTVRVDPASGSNLWPTLALKDPNGIDIATASANGSQQSILLQTIPVTAAGVYTISVGGTGPDPQDLTGAFGLNVLLNAAQELETVGGPADNLPSTPQAIDSSFISLGATASRGAVQGVLIDSADKDYYSFSLAAGETLSANVVATSANAFAQLTDSAGSVLASSAAGATPGSLVIANFTAPAAGQYCLLVGLSVNPSATYTAVITKNANFDTEANDSFAGAQTLSESGALGAIAQTPAATPQVVVPGSLATAEGVDGNANPFNINYFGNPSIRYQQIYARSEFSQPGNITAIRFRRDVNQPAFMTSGIDVKINLGYSAATVASASATFANNVGAGTTTVFDGLLTLSSSGSGTPNPFDIVINLTTPFYYDPTHGDLLFDVFMRNSPRTTWFDASGLGQQFTTQRIYAYDVNATTGVFGTPYGLVTRFDMGPTVNEDWYAIDVNSTAKTLRLETTTPGDGPNEFTNVLNPHLELYDPANVLVATGTPKADGRNELMYYQPLVTGNYRVRVTAESGTTGEYFLSKSFVTVTATHFAVVAGPTATAGSASNFTVTALDDDNITAASYAGTVRFTSSDGIAVLPANATLANGVGTFSATFKTPGTQVLTASDAVSISMAGTSGNITVIPPPQIGDLVWKDINGNGLQDAGEPGVAGAVVELFGSTNAVIGDGDDVSLGIQITDASGLYHFTGPPVYANYYLVFRAPIGFGFTLQDANTNANDAIDSDANANTGRTGLFTLGAGGNLKLDAGLTGSAPAFGFGVDLGGASSNSDYGYGTATDAAGNVYMIGQFQGTIDFDRGSGVYNLVCAGNYDIFVAKYTSVGALAWAKRFGGSTNESVVETGNAIAVDGLGNVYTTGIFSTSNADFDPGSGTYIMASAGQSDTFVSKLDSNGNFVWAKQIGGSSYDVGQGIAVDSAGNVFTAGYFFSPDTDFDPGSGVYTLASAGGADIFVSKLDNN